MGAILEEDEGNADVTNELYSPEFAKYLQVNIFPYFPILTYACFTACGFPPTSVTNNEIGTVIFKVNNFKAFHAIQNNIHYYNVHVHRGISGSSKEQFLQGQRSNVNGQICETASQTCNR